MEPGVRLHAGRPDERVRLDPLPVGEVDAARLGAFERRRGAQLDPAPRQLLRRVVAERPGDLGEDPRRRVDEDPALRVVANLARVAAERVADEIRELGERLHARVARADEDVREVARGQRRVDLRRGSLELSEDVVAQDDRVRQVLELERVLGETRDRQHARDRADREHELLVLDLPRSGLRLHGDDARLLAERGRAADDQLRVRA
jgi:hypothetical protein